MSIWETYQQNITNKQEIKTKKEKEEIRQIPQIKKKPK